MLLSCPSTFLHRLRPSRKNPLKTRRASAARQSIGISRFGLKGNVERLDQGTRPSKQTASTMGTPDMAGLLGSTKVSFGRADNLERRGSVSTSDRTSIRRRSDYSRFRSMPVRPALQLRVTLRETVSFLQCPSVGAAPGTIFSRSCWLARSSSRSTCAGKSAINAGRNLTMSGSIAGAAGTFHVGLRGKLRFGLGWIRQILSCRFRAIDFFSTAW